LATPANRPFFHGSKVVLTYNRAIERFTFASLRAASGLDAVGSGGGPTDQPLEAHRGEAPTWNSMLAPALLTHPALQYTIAIVGIVTAVLVARFVPFANERPGIVLLGSLTAIIIYLPRRPAVAALIVAAFGLEIIVLPPAPFTIRLVRLSLLFVPAGIIILLVSSRRVAVQAEAQYRLIFDRNPLPMWVYDEQTLRFLAVNQAAVDKYGYTREEFARLSLRDIRPEDDLARLETRPARGRPQYTGTWRYRTRDGRVLQVLVRSNLVEHGGRPARLSLLEDITERSAVEAQLRQAQKMEAVGQLAGGIAHDFNNILTAVQGYATLLLESFANDDPRREDVKEIGRAADRAASLTRQLLAFSRKQLLDVRVVAVSAIVKEISPMLRRLVDETVEITTRERATGCARVDPVQLQQVLVNLVVNARDAIQSGGHIIIETSDVMLDAAYASQHQSATPGPHVVLAVSDNGVGMDAETQARIFEPFFTTKPLGRGTGLGLSTVYGIVKQRAASPSDALALAAQPGLGLDLLLTDVVLPQMAGTTAAREVRALHPGCKVLYMSGYTDDAIVRHGLLEEDAAFLHKPFMAGTLVRRVEEVLAS